MLLVWQVVVCMRELTMMRDTVNKGVQKRSLLRVAYAINQ